MTRKTIEAGRRRRIRLRALELSGWTILSGRGSGTVVHPSMPGHSFTIAAAIAHIKRGLVGVDHPEPKLTVPWPSDPSMPSVDLVDESDDDT